MGIPTSTNFSSKSDLFPNANAFVTMRFGPCCLNDAIYRGIMRFKHKHHQPFTDEDYNLIITLTYTIHGNQTFMVDASQLNTTRLIHVFNQKSW